MALLRTEAGRDPHSRELSDLVGELATRSDEFRTRWGAHNVRMHRTGVKQFRHPVVGDLELSFDAMSLPGEETAGLVLTAYTAEPNTPAGARTNWHSHAVGQTLHVTEGVGLVGTRDGKVIRMRAGDTVYTPPSEEHWQEPVTDEQYQLANQA